MNAPPAYGARAHRSRLLATYHALRLHRRQAFFSAPLLFLLLIAALYDPRRCVFAQQAPATTSQSTEPQLVRTSMRNISRRFAYGGTVSLIGAPRGAITIEGWNKSEVEIVAETEVRAHAEIDLDLLAAVNVFNFDEDLNHLRITTVGMHDKKYLRRVAKDFPKRLLTMPWKINYHLRVPYATDLQIYSGEGALKLSGVEGGIEIEGDRTDASLELSGGVVKSTIGRGSLLLKILSRSWRGNGAIIQVGVGDLTMELAPGFSAEIDASVLRTGKIENSYRELVPLERTTPTERSFKGRSGAGGAHFALTVADGQLRIRPISN